MPDAHWTSVVGAVAGAIGAATAVAAIWISIRSARKIHSMKSLDLRLELRQRHTETHSIAKSLKTKIARAAAMKRADMAASGLRSSSYHDQYARQAQADTETVAGIMDRLAPEGEAFAGLDPEALEIELVSLHASLTALRDLDSTYTDSMEKDQQRAERRAERFHSG